MTRNELRMRELDVLEKRIQEAKRYATSFLAAEHTVE